MTVSLMARLGVEGYIRHDPRWGAVGCETRRVRPTAPHGGTTTVYHGSYHGSTTVDVHGGCTTDVLRWVYHVVHWYIPSPHPPTHVQQPSSPEWYLNVVYTTLKCTV